MTVYNTEHLYQNIADLKYLNVSTEDVRDTWSDFGQEIHDTYLNGECTEVQLFAKFGFNSKGQPNAVLLDSFLKGNGSRFNTDETIDQSAKFQPLIQSNISNGRQLLPFIFAELSNAFLHKVAKINLLIPNLGEFNFDRRQRTYTFTFGKDINSRESTLVPEKRALSNASHRSSSVESRASSVKSEREEDYYGNSYEEEPVAPQSAPQKLKQLEARSVSAKSTRSEKLSEMEDFGDDVYLDAHPEPTTHRSKPQMFARSLDRSLGRKGEVVFDNSYQKVLEGEFEAAKQNYLESNETADEIKRSLSVPTKKISCCRKCMYDEDVRLKTERLLKDREEERDQYNAMAETNRKLFEERELAHSYHHSATEKAFHDANVANAEEIYHKKHDYKVAGHYLPEGYAEENVAVLADDPNLVATRRAVATLVRDDEINDDDLKKQRLEDKAEFQEDYINRLILQEGIKKERLDDYVYKLSKEEEYAEDLDKELNTAKIARVPRSLGPMRCPVPECFDRGLEVERRFQENEKDASDFNEIATAVRYETLKADALDGVDDVRRRDAAATESLQDEIRDRHAAKMTLRKDLTETYDADIAARRERSTQARVDSWQDMNKYRFKDEKIDSTECQNCERSYPWSNCFEVKEAENIIW